MRVGSKSLKAYLALALALPMLAGCGEDKAPKPKTDASTDSHPVKNVDSLPAGTIQEGARAMNQGAGMGGSLEQQKQERDKEVESQSR